MKTKTHFFTAADVPMIETSLKGRDGSLIVFCGRETIEREVVVPQKTTWRKPHGLWFSYGTNWLAWVMENRPDFISNYQGVYEIQIEEQSILSLGSEEEVRVLGEANATVVNILPGTQGRDTNMKWAAIAEQFKGINISPYSKDVDLGLDSYLWYYGWDVDGGCIWDTSSIREVTRII